MRYLSLFSGIEAATEAWAPLGWECVGFAEVNPSACRLLAHYWPHIPNLGDVTAITETAVRALGHIDLVVFGSPCQDLSVVGNRKGLSGERSGLFVDAVRIARWSGARFALWENVPGAFTSNAGRDFATVVELLAGLEPGTCVVPPKGWGNEGCAVGDQAMVEWCTLDAQWNGVAQRRRRVFALADSGNWLSRPPILLEPEGVRGDSAPSRQAREDATADAAHGIGDAGREVVGTLDASFGRLQGASGQDANHGHSHLVVAVDTYNATLTGDVSAAMRAGGADSVPHLLQAFGGNNQAGPIDVLTALNASGTASGRLDFESETFVVSDAIAYMPSRTIAADGGVDERFAAREVCVALHTSSRSGNEAPLIAFHVNAQSDQQVFDTEVSSPLTCSQRSGVMQGDLRVRRLTELECERLQAFPDGHTAIPGATASARYKALGNSMCVNTMHWIGQQIDFVWRFC